MQLKQKEEEVAELKKMMEYENSDKEEDSGDETLENLSENMQFILGDRTWEKKIPTIGKSNLITLRSKTINPEGKIKINHTNTFDTSDNDGNNNNSDITENNDKDTIKDKNEMSWKSGQVVFSSIFGGVVGGTLAALVKNDLLGKSIGRNARISLVYFGIGLGLVVGPVIDVIQRYNPSSSKNNSNNNNTQKG